MTDTMYGGIDSQEPKINMKRFHWLEEALMTGSDVKEKKRGSSEGTECKELTMACRPPICN